MIETSLSHPIKNIAAYAFLPLDRLPERRKQLRTRCRELGLSGTILLSSEGINLFLAGPRRAVETFWTELKQDPLFAPLESKDSYSCTVPFRRMLVKIKREIISFDQPEITTADAEAQKISARTLKQWLDEGRPLTLLDVRNDYEIRVGAFQQALPMGLQHFRDFPERVNALPQEMKRQTIVMYCTGGIRCEKAGPFMQKHGFENVYQLDGGILKYFEECGDAHYSGDCFVFDQRVAVDARLEETATTMCFACQSPLSPEDQASSAYVVGKSCPHCLRSPEETMERQLARRQRLLEQTVAPLPGSVPYENVRPIFVPTDVRDKPIREFLTTLFPHVSWPEWQASIAAGNLRRNGEVLCDDACVSAGERLQHAFPGTIEPDVDARIEILYEDDYLIAVKKPAPLPMHPSGRFNRNTLIHILNEVYAPQVLRVAHRLDANTTGVVILSRTRAAASLLQPQFERGEVEKRYLVEVQGVPDADHFTCDAPIAEQSLPGGIRFVAADGLPSLTEFRVIERLGQGTTLLEVRPRTGRTNQIRLHSAHLGLPVCGDPAYGVSATRTPRITLNVGEPPLRLHAWKLAFRHPSHGKPIRFTAGVPTWWPHANEPRDLVE